MSTFSAIQKEAYIKELSFYKISKTSITYKVIAELLELPNHKKTYMVNENENETIIRTCYTSGRGRYTSNQDHTTSIEVALRKIGIVNFETLNDAPRGGATGKYILIKKF